MVRIQILKKEGIPRDNALGIPLRNPKRVVFLTIPNASSYLCQMNVPGRLPAALRRECSYFVFAERAAGVAEQRHYLVEYQGATDTTFVLFFCRLPDLWRRQLTSSDFVLNSR